MKKTLPQRLELLFADLGINQMVFSQRTGFKQPYISQIMNGSRTNPSIRFYDSVCREFNVNTEWLKNGSGEMYLLPDGAGDTLYAEIVAKFRLLPKDEQRIIEDMINALLAKSEDMKNKKKKT